MSLAARLAALLLALVVAVGMGWRAGVTSTRAAWLQADQERDQALAAARDEDRRLAARAGAAHEAVRATINHRRQEARHAIDTAMQAPAPCPGPEVALGDIVVPAAALGGLRLAAGAQPGGDRPAAFQLGRAVFGRPGDPGR